MPERAISHGRLPQMICGLLLVLFVVLGGGTRQGLPIEAALQLLALLALLFVTLIPAGRPWQREAGLCALWLACVAALLLIQLIPLPPAIWSSLSGRQELAHELALAGVAPQWRPVSLDPPTTLRALLALLPPTVVFLVATRLSLHRRIVMLKLVLMLAMASVILGFAQLAGGSQSPLRWHEVTSATNAVGPFANRNHLAALLALCLPLAAAWLMSILRQRRRDIRAAYVIAAGFMLVLLVLGLAVSRSRAGVLLGGAALIGIGLMVWVHRQRLQPGETRPLQLKRWLLLAFFIGGALSLQYGLIDLWGRLKVDPLEDHRWRMASTTVEAIKSFGALGTGAGTFPVVYPSVENPSQRNEYYVNRAHNDWLEWTLEGGWPLMLIVLLGVGLLLSMARKVSLSESRLSPWQTAATVAVGLLALHSAVDYPLRTTALACIAALLVACMLPEPPGPGKPPRRRRTGNLVLETGPDGTVRSRSSLDPPPISASAPDPATVSDSPADAERDEGPASFEPTGWNVSPR